METLDYKTLKDKEIEELRELGEERDIENVESLDRGDLIAEILEYESDSMDSAGAAMDTAPNVEVEDSSADLDTSLSASSPGGSNSGGDNSGDGDSASGRQQSRSSSKKSRKQSSNDSGSGSSQSNGSDGSSGGPGQGSGNDRQVRTKGDDFEEDADAVSQQRKERAQKKQQERKQKQKEREEQQKKKQEQEQKLEEKEDREKGILDYPENGSYGFMRQKEFNFGKKEIYVSMSLIEKFNLRTGDMLIGKTRPPKGDEHFHSLTHIDTVFGTKVTELGRRPEFHDLTPIHPQDRLLLETTKDEISTRMIDLFAPIGKGQRGIIVSKPKAGKTTMLKKIAQATAENHPEVQLAALLVDERPEEVTDFERSIDGEVFSSTFDEKPENHIKVSELTLEYAKRRVEMGQDVMILLDSLTRLARAYNLTCSPSGKTLSGGLDPNSVHPPKSFLGAARNIENGGSLTILCTALIETGSKLDDIIYEEFKGTANMELHLSRELADKRIFPALDPVKSGTRQEEKIYRENEMDLIWSLRQMISNMSKTERMNKLVKRLESTESNAELLLMIKDAMGT